MSAINPYEAPQTVGGVLPVGVDPSSPLIVVNSCLVAAKGSDLPDVCIYSGQVGGNIYVSKTLTRAPSWVLLLIILIPLLGIIVYFLTKRRGRIGYYISPEQRSSRRTWLLINWLIFLGAFVSVFVAVAVDKPEGMAALPILLLTSLIIYFVKIRGLYAEWIDPFAIGLKGIKPSIMEILIQSQYQKARKPPQWDEL